MEIAELDIVIRSERAVKAAADVREALASVGASAEKMGEATSGSMDSAVTNAPKVASAVKEVGKAAEGAAKDIGAIGEEAKKAGGKAGGRF